MNTKVTCKFPKSHFLHIMFPAFLLLCIIFIASGQDSWEWRHPVPQGNNLFSVVYFENTFVASGNGGTVLTSTDGKQWEQQNTGTTRRLMKMTQGAGKLCAVGDKGTIITSPDGKVWTDRISGISSQLWAITYGNNLFVAVGDRGVILISSDGVTWTKIPSNIDGEDLLTVAYGNNLFVSVSREGTVITSSNGTEWTKTATNVTQLFPVEIVFGNGLFVVANDKVLKSSTDGTNWQVCHTDTRDLNSVEFASSRFFAIGSGTLRSSSDGADWQMLASVTSNTLNSIAYGGNTFVSVGNGGIIISSQDGVTWTKESIGADSWAFLNSITYGKELYVVVGLRYLLVSTDGRNWTNIATSETDDLYSVAFGKDRFAAVGMDGTVVGSADGYNWTKYPVPIQEHLNSLVFRNDMFVAVGRGGTIITSSDGENWTVRSSGVTTELTGITFDNGLFVAVGNSGTVVTSPDGINWISHSTGLVGLDLTSVAFGKGKYVAFDKFGDLITSTDGQVWTEGNSVEGQIQSIYFDGNRFIAVGAWGVVYESPDGLNYTRLDLGIGTHLYCIANVNSQLFLIGSEGTIIALNPGSTESFSLPVRNSRLAGINAFRKNDRVHLALPCNMEAGQVKVTLHTLDGKVVYTQSSIVNGRTLTVDIKGLPKVSYIISVLAKGRTWSALVQ